MLYFDGLSMKISIGNDHAGTDHKYEIMKYLESRSIAVINRGTDGKDSVDYPDFAHLVSQDVETSTVDFGILICGSGNGVSMAANKHKSVRCALCWNIEIASLARKHNDANIIAIPARFVDFSEAVDMVEVFLRESFEGGRHTKRVNKISAC